jgi:hypothetical protein
MRSAWQLDDLTGTLCAKAQEGDCLEDLGVDGCIILKWILKEWDGRAWSGFIWLKIGKSSGPF